MSQQVQTLRRSGLNRFGWRLCVAVACYHIGAAGAAGATFNLTPQGGNGSISAAFVTLSELLADSENMLVVGDLEFSQFAYFAIGELVGPQEIEVYGMRDATGSWGVSFQADWTDAPGGTPGAASLQYVAGLQGAASSSGWRLTQASLGMAGVSVGDDSQLSVSQSFEEVDQLLTVQALAIGTSEPEIVSDAAGAISPSAAELTVLTDVFFMASDMAAVPAGISGFEQSFVQQIPGSSTPGDFNGDSFVNGQDFDAWSNSFGDGDGADADGDLDSDGADFLVWQRELGTSAARPSSAAIPEPHTLALAIGGFLAACRALRRS